MGRGALAVVSVVLGAAALVTPACDDTSPARVLAASDASSEASALGPGDAAAACSFRDKLGQACTAESECCGVDCVGGKCCLDSAVDCTADAECCSGTCRNGHCACFSAGQPIQGDGRDCCTLNAKDGKCIFSRPGFNCATDTDCEVIAKCTGRTCAHLPTGGTCTAASECLSSECPDGTCACRKKAGETACCADVGADCGTSACCFGACDGGKCSCEKSGKVCSRNEDCCSSRCLSAGGDTSYCCGSGGDGCEADSDCCGRKCSAAKTCCKELHATCTTKDECCTGECVEGVCCRGAGEGCADNGASCCGGLSCSLQFTPAPKSYCKRPD